MLILCKKFDGSFFDEDYFEKGKISGKSWYMNYRWLPERSTTEAKAIIDYLQLNENHKILDFGCAKGFLVKALRMQNIETEGCDISDYALSFAPGGCWNSSIEKNWENKKYTHVIVKDVFEHLTPVQLFEILNKISKVSSKILCIVPIGDNGVYRIPEYHCDISHIIAENEEWWKGKFEEGEWNIITECEHIPGLKDNWYHVPNGNRVFLLEGKEKL